MCPPNDEQILLFQDFLKFYIQSLGMCTQIQQLNKLKQQWVYRSPVVASIFNTPDVTNIGSPEPALTVEDFTSAIMSTGLGLPGRTSDRSNEDERWFQLPTSQNGLRMTVGFL